MNFVEDHLMNIPIGPVSEKEIRMWWQYLTWHKEEYNCDTEMLPVFYTILVHIFM